MRIGIIGTRGIPNAYGGFEQFAENFSARMVQRGHEVTVYCSSRHPYQHKAWKGVQLLHRRDPEGRMGTFGQFIYDFNCLLDARKRGFDILLFLGYTSSSVWMWLAPHKPVSITNMDGLEWKRQKYRKPVRWFLKHAEKWAVRSSDALIADSPAIQSYLRRKYGKDAFYAAYGAEVFENPDSSVPQKFGLTPYAYSMLIARPEPENHIHTICEGYLKSGCQEPLLIIGNFSNPYGRSLQQQFKAPQFRFCGPIYETETLNHLRFFSRLYFHGHSVGGTNPSLLEAMASSALVCAHENEFNRGVLGTDAFYFSSAAEISALLGAGIEKQNHRDFLQANLSKIRGQYSWEHICNELETFFQNRLQA